MTNEETDCIHGLYPATSCTICHPKFVEPASNRSGKTMIAIHNGQCSDCNLPIFQDHSVIKEYRGKWLHKRCAEFLEKNKK